MEMREKIERLTEAFYRVTDLFPDEEPIKWILRKKALEILERASRLEREPFHKQAEDVKALSWLIPETVNLLKLAWSGTFVSRVNFELLAREYNALLGFLNSGQENLLFQAKDKEGADNFPKVAERMTEKMAERPKMADRMSDKASDRTAEIIEFFQKNNNQLSNATDIIKIFKNKDKKVSFRTIRRNLEKLAKNGLLTQEGDNRWRKYALKENPLKNQ